MISIHYILGLWKTCSYLAKSSLCHKRGNLFQFESFDGGIGT